MSVIRDSNQAKPHWDDIRGVNSVTLQEDAIISGKAIIELTEVDETFKGNIVNYPDLPNEGEKVPVTVQRHESTGVLDVDSLEDIPVFLTQSVVIGGTATVELTEVDGPLHGEIVDLDFIPQTGDRFEMSVTRDSDQAKPYWDDIRGVSSVTLQEDAIASDKAIVEVTGVGEVFTGRIVDYLNLHGAGEKVRAVVSEDQKKAYYLSPKCNLVLDEPAELSGEADIMIAHPDTL